MNKTTRPLVPASPMPAPLAPAVIDDGFIKSRIHTIRGVQVMLDRDLAELYSVPTKRLNEQVKRNAERFPPNFMFVLSQTEMRELVANCDRFASMKHSTVPMTAFTEHGILMLASVLKSGVAVHASIRITNIFVAMRKALSAIAPVMARIEEAERRQLEEKTARLSDQQRNEERFDVIFKAMDGGDFPPQKVFYDGQLWDARAFVDKLVKSARKSLVLVDNWATVETLDMLAAKRNGVAVTVVTSEHRDHFSRMPPRGSTAGGIRRLPGLASRLTRARAFCYSQIRQPHRALVDAGLPSPVKEL